MKHFLRDVFVVIVGLVIFSAVATCIGLMGIVGTMASSGSSAGVQDGSVLVLNLQGTLQEQASDATPMDMIQGNGEGNPGLTDMLSAIQKAKSSDKIKGIYIESNDMGMDMSQAQELRDAIVDFKKSGKWVIAYGKQYGTLAYYIASSADKVYLNPMGMIEWQGLGTTPIFLKDLYNKFGIKFQVFKCGKYKSATETYTEDKMSGPSREQAQRYVSYEWNTIVDAVSKSRKVSARDLNTYADNLITFDGAKLYEKYKLVDGLLYNDEIKNVIKKKLGIDKDTDIPQATVADMQTIDNSTEGDKVAVYYASGTIVDEVPQQNAFMQQQYIVGDDVCKDLNDLAKDDKVKAVVLRVNSPGGSGYSSEQIWHAVEMLKKAGKPVVVSMSGYAASGGYYISSGANYIFAEPTTITGSIGIFGAIPTSAELQKKLGIKYDAVVTNKNATAGTPDLMGLAMLSPFTAEQSQKLQTYIDQGYMLFKSRVAQGRKLSMAAVEERAQGHVFVGADALKLKLVDELGGLDKAVAKAAQLAKLKKYYAQDYPAPKSFIEQLMDQTDKSKGTLLDEKLQSILGIYYAPFMLLQNVEAMGPVQARLPYIITKKK
jgi:protease-4